MSVDSRGSSLQPMPFLVTKETAKSEFIRITPETIPYPTNEIGNG